MPPAIDLNCDLGEGAGHDIELMPLITSANIACGAHAGDDATMRATIALAQRHGVAIGAHPGFADLANFGRRELPVTPAAAAALMVEQTMRLNALAARFGARATHVKLHGALYNLVSRDEALANAVVSAVVNLNPSPALFALAGSKLEHVARASGRIRVVAEVFADRTYQADGSLTPRTRPDALIHDEARAVAQVLRMLRDGIVRATDGTEVPIRADTVCVHGDGPRAVAFARRLNADLRQAGIAIKAVA